METIRGQICTRVWTSGDHRGRDLVEHTGGAEHRGWRLKGEERAWRGSAGGRSCVFMSTSGETKHDTLGKLKVLQCSWDREAGWVRGFQNDGELKGCTQRGLISHIKEFGLYLKGMQNH